MFWSTKFRLTRSICIIRIHSATLLRWIWALVGLFYIKRLIHHYKSLSWMIQIVSVLIVVCVRNWVYCPFMVVLILGILKSLRFVIINYDLNNIMLNHFWSYVKYLLSPSYILIFYRTITYKTHFYRSCHLGNLNWWIFQKKLSSVLSNDSKHTLVIYCTLNSRAYSWLTIHIKISTLSLNSQLLGRLTCRLWHLLKSPQKLKKCTSFYVFR